MSAIAFRAEAIEIPRWCFRPITDAFLNTLPDYSFVSERNKIRAAKNEWVRRIREPNFLVNVAELDDLQTLALFEAYTQERGIRPLMNIKQMREQGTLDQQAKLADLIAHLQAPLSGRQLAKVMTQLYKLQLDMDPRWLGAPEWAQKLRRKFLFKLPEEKVRARLETQMIEDEGQLFQDIGVADSKPPSSKAAIAREVALYVAVNGLVYHLTGLSPLDAPIIPTVNLLAFTNLFKRWARTGDTRNFHQQYLKMAKELGVPIPKTGLTVAQVDFALNLAIRGFMYWRYWELAEFMTGKEARFLYALASELLTKTPEQWANEELQGFMQGDVIRKKREEYIRDAIEGWHIRFPNTPVAQYYIDNQYILWGNLTIEELAVNMTEKEIAIFKDWYTHRTEFRWNKALEIFKFKDEITQMRDHFVAAAIKEAGPDFENTPYNIAFLRDDFDYWDLAEAKKALSYKDFKIFESWRELRRKIHLEENKGK